MAFDVVVLGSGTVIPDGRRAPACHLLVADGHQVLLDCGPLAAHRLAAHGCGPHDLDAVALSHLHGDHSAGLVPLLQSMWAHPRFRRQRPLPMAAPARVREVLAACGTAWPSVAESVDNLVRLHAWEA